VATLVDEHGNKYRAIHFDEIGFEGFGDVGWNSQLDQEYNKSSETNAILAYNLSLHPGKSYITYLFYEKSAAVAKEARLTLPSKELGGTGTIRLLVPISNPAVERVVNPAEGPASKPPNEFTIVQAKFGTGADWADVKEQVRKLVKDSRLHLIVPREGSALPQLGFPDPAPNRLKQLVVVYAVNGKQQSVTVEAGQELNLPPVGQVNSPPAKPAEKPAEAPIRKGTITFYVVVNSPGYFDSTGVKRNYRIGDTGTFPKSNPLTKTYRLNELSKDMIGHTVLCVKVRKDGAIIAQVREITSASGQGLAAYFSRAFVVKGLDVKKLNLKDKSVWDPGEEEYKVTGTEKNATGDVFLVFEPVKPDKVEPAGKDADRKHKE
jgi:hypothetical protein